MKLYEAERLVKNWKEAKDRVTLVGNLKHSCGDVFIANNGTSRLVLTKMELEMICNILDNTIREREQNLRERIANELNIDIEA